MFREKLRGGCSTQPIFKQYLMVGMFTADLEFLSKFLGHQGACARYLCMFCQIVKAQCKEVFADPSKPAVVPKRTLESIIADAEKYYSIIELPMLNEIKIDEDCSAATVHVLLGMTAWMAKTMRKSYKRLEELEAAETGADQALSTGAIPNERRSPEGGIS
mmetsp:Transcript_32260/g.55046  ORF Transcript_32260/g.55046 Transcript_32260/m.55046 type:complete len:161 (+) Transcript_32260:467-949(+)